MISNENLEAREILSIYRQKDVAEKAFHNIKDRLDARRLRVSSNYNGWKNICNIRVISNAIVYKK